MLRDSYGIPARLLDRASVVEKFISSNRENTEEVSWSRQREQKKGRQREHTHKKELSSGKVSLLSEEDSMFLCHRFPFSWQREESQGRVCQCESSLKVWRLQLDIASGLTPKDRDNTPLRENVPNNAETHTHTTRLHVPVLHEMHVDTTAVCTPSIISSRQQAELLTSKICHALLAQ